MRDLRTLSPKCDIFIKPLPQGQAYNQKRKQKGGKKNTQRWCHRSSLPENNNNNNNKTNKQQR